MLCLTRKEHQSVTCRLPNGDEIRVSVVLVRRDRIVLGFEAPQSVDIVRDELNPRTFRRRPKPEQRTREQVLAARNSVIGCCERNADRQGCDCLEKSPST